MFINFYPQQTGEAREIWIDKHAGYAPVSLDDFIKEVIGGCPSSTALSGAVEAVIGDDFIKSIIADGFDESAVKEAAEEIYNAIADH